jgi:hypothetical protein
MRIRCLSLFVGTALLIGVLADGSPAGASVGGRALGPAAGIAAIGGGVGYVVAGVGG